MKHPPFDKGFPMRSTLYKKIITKAESYFNKIFKKILILILL